MVNLREVPGEFAFTMNRPKNIIWLFCLISRFRLIFSCYSRSHTISNFSCVQPVRYFVLFSAGVPRDFAPFILDRANFANFFFCFICSVWHFFLNCYTVPKGLCRVSFVYRHVGKLWNYFRDSVCLFKEEA